MFSNEELQKEFLNISEMFNISIETVGDIYEKLVKYPCFDREKGIECLGVACDIREEHLSQARRLLEAGELNAFQVPEFLRSEGFSVDTAIKKALLITYDYSEDPEFAKKHGLVK